MTIHANPYYYSDSVSVAPVHVTKTDIIMVISFCFGLMCTGKGLVYFNSSNKFHTGPRLALFITGIVLDVVAIISFCNKPQGQVSYNQLRQTAVI